MTRRPAKGANRGRATVFSGGPTALLTTLFAVAIGLASAPGVIAQGTSKSAQSRPSAKQDTAKEGEQEKKKTKKKQQKAVKHSDLRFSESKFDGDAVKFIVSGGGWLKQGTREIRFESAVVRFDRDEYWRVMAKEEDGLPRRGTSVPDPRRALTAAVMRRRLRSFVWSLTSTGEAPDKEQDADPAQSQWMNLVRSIYLSGNIVVIDSGEEVLTAKSLLFSVPDNRAVFEGVQMRLVTRSKSQGDKLLVVRAPRLIKQGTRFVGRNVSMTTCSAGEPHFEILSGQMQIIERPGEFEIVTRDNTLAFSGRRTVGLPDAQFFTSEQNNFPLKGLKASYSAIDGMMLNVDVGGSINETGGAIHEFLTGGPANDFRGEWRLGLGYNELRGHPLEGEIRYSGGKRDEGWTYEGWLKGFALHDGGFNYGLVTTNLDGTIISNSKRRLLRSENRFHLAENWRLDVSAFIASDPAVYPEFFDTAQQAAELPESSLHLRHVDDNHLFTFTARANLATFSYADDRGLSPSFVEELPVATYDVFDHKLFEVLDADVLLNSSTELGVLRHEFDKTFAPQTKDRTVRFDQELEVSAPFSFGPVKIRPYASSRLTYYDNSVAMTEQERWALDAGVSVSTRLARTWRWKDEDGSESGIRHAIYPSISFGRLFQVDGDRSDYFQFDEIDSLNEHGTIRVGLLNRFQKFQIDKKWARRRTSALGDQDRANDLWLAANSRSHEAREFLFLDLAQNFLPVAYLDQNGAQIDDLGLFEYEVIWRPNEELIPVPNLRVLVEGEHDWETGQLHTHNSAIRFGQVLGLNWTAGFRTDAVAKGTVHYGISTALFGRWGLGLSGAQDLSTDEPLAYNLGLARYDHDWLFSVGLSYSTITDQTSFAFNFQPSFGGLFGGRPRDFAGTHGTGADAMLSY